MSKHLGSVELGDNERLEGIAKEAGIMLDADEIWQEAKDYMQANDTDEAEVRIRGLDYIEVYQEKESKMTREPTLEQQAYLVDVAHERGNISPVKLWEAYLDMLDANFEQDVIDLAKELNK